MLRLLLACIAVFSLQSGTAALAVPCPYWELPSPFVAVQDNGYWVTFYLQQDGERVWGKAGYSTTKKPLVGATRHYNIIGKVKGGISGDRLFMRAYWTDSGRNSIGVYIGKIVDGFIQGGSTYDEMAVPAKTVRWHTGTPLVCRYSVEVPGTAAAPQPLGERKIQETMASKAKKLVIAPDPDPTIQELTKSSQKQFVPPQRMATVTSDVDLYDVPGGGGMVIGMLEGGSAVPLITCREDQWCHVGAGAAGAQGWVWGEFLAY